MLLETMSFPPLLNPQTPKLSSLFFFSPIQLDLYPPRTSPKSLSFSSSFPQSSLPLQNDDLQDDPVIGDCLVFEDDIFDDPYLQTPIPDKHQSAKKGNSRTKPNNKVAEVEPQNLVPQEWMHVQAEVNITKKERRKLAQQLEFGVRVEKRKQGLLPIKNFNSPEHFSYKQAKLAQLKPLVLDDPSSIPVKEGKEPAEDEMEGSSSGERVAPKNPRWAVYGRGFEDISKYFNSFNYEPGDKKSQGPRKLFTKEEKVLLNSRVPDLSAATSSKWLPLHTLAASGEFYLLHALLKHNVDINAVDKDGLTALHRAIIGKKQAITNYLLRESANPFVRDKKGATLMHYAVQTASIPAIKLLLLYNVDINLQDNDGWTPLHVAVQGRRTDIVKLLLIKGADETLKNKDGLTPLELCLYFGRDTRTYELIKLLKQLPRRSNQTMS